MTGQEYFKAGFEYDFCFKTSRSQAESLLMRDGLVK